MIKEISNIANLRILNLYMDIEKRFPRTAQVVRQLVSKYFPGLARYYGKIYKSLSKIHYGNNHILDLDLVVEKEKQIFLKLKKSYSQVQPKCIVVGILPPSTSSIARYNLKVYAHANQVAFLASNYSISQALESFVLTGQQIIPQTEASFFIDANAHYVLTLGNSPEHIKSIETFAEINKNYDKSYTLQLHEVDLFWLLSLILGNNFMENSKNVTSSVEKVSRIASGLTALFLICGVPSQIIVHTRLAEELIARALKVTNITISKGIFVVSIPTVDSKDELHEAMIRSDRIGNTLNSEIRVGTFGAADSHKEIEYVFEVLKKVQKNTPELNWVIAGKNAHLYTSSNRIRAEWITIYDAPSHFELLQLMASCNFALQFRWNPNGEASGIFQQLRSMQVPTLYSKESTWEDANPLSRAFSKNESLGIPLYIRNLSGSRILSRKVTFDDPIDTWNQIWKIVSENL